MTNYIQIGANIGGDEFRQRMCHLPNPSTIHLIEPNILLHEELRNSYSDLSEHEIHIHNFGISTENNSELELNLYTETGHSSLINRRSHQCKTDSLKIECKTFNDFCKERSITHVELLYIDAEGLDYEIINSIDLNIVKINEIICEVWPYDNDDMNGNFRTGESFLNSVVIPKLKDYTCNTLVIEGANSLQFKLK